MTTHDLKVWPQFWDDFVAGVKMFDVRRDDRGFQVGDELLLREWFPPDGTYSGRRIHRRVTYVLHASDCPAGAITAGYVALGLEVCEGRP